MTQTKQASDITATPLTLNVVEAALTRLGFYRADAGDATLFREDRHQAVVLLPRMEEGEQVLPSYLHAIQTTVVGRGVATAERFNQELRRAKFARRSSPRITAGSQQK